MIPPQVFARSFEDLQDTPKDVPREPPGYPKYPPRTAKDTKAGPGLQVRHKEPQRIAKEPLDPHF